jgi:hypothetical protein
MLVCGKTSVGYNLQEITEEQVIMLLQMSTSMLCTSGPSVYLQSPYMIGYDWLDISLRLTKMSPSVKEYYVRVGVSCDSVLMSATLADLS